MIVAGFGFRGSATADSLRAAYDGARDGAQAQLLATAEDKAQSAAFVGFAASLGLPYTGVAMAEVPQQQTATRSEHALRHRGTGSLAEAAALAAAGPRGRLLTPRVISEDGRATCALAITGEPQ